MSRLEKLILEQLKKGQYGEKPGDQDLKSKLNNKFKYGVISHYFIDKHGKGNKYKPFTIDQVIERIPKSINYSKYSNGKYVFVVDGQNPKRGQKETLWGVYILDKQKTFPDIYDQVFALNKSGQFNQSFIITFKQYDELLKKQNELAIAKEKADAEAAAAAKKKPTVKKTKDVVQGVIKGTETIDTNNLGKGTPDAKAFQELLYQVGLKLIPTYKAFKKFASYRTAGADGGWDGDIGPATLNMLDKLSLKDKYLSGDRASVIKDLRSALKTNESVNYFKGIGMNLKLKDLLQEQIKIKPDDDVDSSGGSTSTNTRRSRSKKFTPDTFSSNYTGKGKITYNSGDTFTGSWENGKKSGQGTYKSKDGTTYNGTWSNGKMTGEFTIEYSNGDKRVGTYNSNGLNGTVTFTPKGGTPVQETWKDGKKIKSNKEYWDIVKKWVQDEYDFWENGGSGPEGQKNPLTHRQMFEQFNYTWDDDETNAKRAYMLNRKIALKWLKKQLEGDYTYYIKVENWIKNIGDQIDDYFQNDVTITLRNNNEGEIFTRTVQPEIDV